MALRNTTRWSDWYARAGYLMTTSTLSGPETPVMPIVTLQPAFGSPCQTDVVAITIGSPSVTLSGWLVGLGAKPLGRCARLRNANLRYADGHYAKEGNWWTQPYTTRTPYSSADTLSG